jgi:hypothetical protein
MSLKHTPEITNRSIRLLSPSTANKTRQFGSSDEASVMIEIDLELIVQLNMCLTNIMTHHKQGHSAIIVEFCETWWSLARANENDFWSSLRNSMHLV